MIETTVRKNGRRSVKLICKEKTRTVQADKEKHCPNKLMAKHRRG
jgi:hypothetical protein